MAQTVGTKTSRDLLALLFREAPRVSFYQAVRILEQLFPETPAIGYEGPASQEHIRIRPSLALSVPTADIESIQPMSDGKIQITTTFLGLYGVDSPLPYAYPEHLLQISDEPAGKRIRAYLDIFHHRLYSLLHRAWKKSRPISGSVRSLDPLLERVLSLLGYSPSLGLGIKDGETPHLSEARLLVLRSRTAAGLEALLKRRLGYASYIHTLQRRYVQVPADQLSRLGKKNAVLGDTFLVGARLEDYNKVSIKIDAADYAMFQRLLPEGADRRVLDSAVKRYLLDPLDYDVEVSLPSKHIPSWRLGKQGALGRSTWLGALNTSARCSWPGRNAII